MMAAIAPTCTAFRGAQIVRSSRTTAARPAARLVSGGKLSAHLAPSRLCMIPPHQLPDHRTVLLSSCQKGPHHSSSCIHHSCMCRRLPLPLTAAHCCCPLFAAPQIVRAGPVKNDPPRNDGSSADDRLAKDPVS